MVFFDMREDDGDVQGLDSVGRWDVVVESASRLYVWTPAIRFLCMILNASNVFQLQQVICVSTGSPSRPTPQLIATRQQRPIIPTKQLFLGSQVEPSIEPPKLLAASFSLSTVKCFIPVTRPRMWRRRRRITHIARRVEDVRSCLRSDIALQRFRLQEVFYLPVPIQTSRVFH